MAADIRVASMHTDLCLHKLAGLLILAVARRVLAREDKSRCFQRCGFDSEICLQLYPRLEGNILASNYRKA